MTFQSATMRTLVLVAAAAAVLGLASAETKFGELEYMATLKGSSKVM